EVTGIGQDDLAAALGIEDDLRLFERRHVIVEALHRYLARRKEAVALRDVAGDDAVDVERHDLGIFVMRAEGADDALKRPHPAERAGPPFHALRPGEGADRGRHDLGNDLGRRAAGLLGDGDVEIALRIVLDFRLVYRRQAGRLQEAGKRLFR